MISEEAAFENVRHENLRIGSQLAQNRLLLGQLEKTNVEQELDRQELEDEFAGLEPKLIDALNRMIALKKWINTEKRRFSVQQSFLDACLETDPAAAELKQLEGKLTSLKQQGNSVSFHYS